MDCRTVVVIGHLSRQWADVAYFLALHFGFQRGWSGGGGHGLQAHISFVSLTTCSNVLYGVVGDKRVAFKEKYMCQRRDLDRQ